MYLIEVTNEKRGESLDGVGRECENDDETLLNLIKTKHPMKGENKEQRKGRIVGPKNKNPQPRGQERGVKKSHVFDTLPPTPPLTRNMSKNRKRGTPKKTPSLEECSQAITTCFEIDAYGEACVNHVLKGYY